MSKIRVSEIRVSEIRGSEIRGSEIRVSEIRVSKIRISSNHRELHGAIFDPERERHLVDHCNGVCLWTRRSVHAQFFHERWTLRISPSLRGKSPIHCLQSVGQMDVKIAHESEQLPFTASRAETRLPEPFAIPCGRFRLSRLTVWLVTTSSQKEITSSSNAPRFKPKLGCAMPVWLQNRHQCVFRKRTNGNCICIKNHVSGL